MPRYGNNARGVRKMIADDKAEAHVQRTQPKVCGCGYPPHVGRCQPKLMPSPPQQAVIMLQHIINLFPDEPDVIFVAAVAIADIATEAANNGTIVDPLMGSDFVPPSPAPWKFHLELQHPQSDEHLAACPSCMMAHDKALPDVPSPAATATESSTGPIQVFSDRELATVLYALREIQMGLHDTDDVREEMAVSEHFDHCTPLDESEIDVLCERLNLA